MTAHHHSSLKVRPSHKREDEIIVALVGNPNSGKTTIFNQLTGSNQKVGNWGGVTVERRDGWVRKRGQTFRIIDLPGMYSLSAVSPDEEIARDFIVHGIEGLGRPHIVVQVVDAGRLERNLLLTLQLCDQELPLVVVLNMFDEVRRRNIVIDPRKLSHHLGVPVVPTVGTKGEGIAQLLETLENLAASEKFSDPPIRVAFSPAAEEALENIKERCLEEGYNISRGYAIGLLTGEPSAGRHFPPPLLSAIRALANQKKPHLGNSWADEITHYRYSTISRLMGLVASPYPSDEDTLTHRLDSIFIHPYWGIPIFLVVLFILFQITFSFGAIPMGWIDQGMSQLSRLVVRLIPGIWGQIIGEGVIGGAGMILVFLPNIILLMMGIHLLEDSGYMARAAFLMDRMMRLMRLHGKAFIPLLMGFGCNVPALLATRTLESHRDRLLTMLITPFISCSARLPVYVMITAALFPRSGGLIIFGLYILGIAIAIIMGRLLSRTLLKGQSVPFVLELPPYRWPTLKTTYRLLKFSTWLFIKRIGTLVACSAVFIWFLTYFPPSSSPTMKSDAPLVGYRENSYIYYIGRAVEPLFAPLGFTVKMDIALISGFVAKEVVVSTFGVLLAGSEEAEEGTLRSLIVKEIPSPAVGLAFLVFVLLYTPCLTTVVTFQRETRRWMWTIFSVGYQFLTAYALSLLTLILARGMGLSG